MAKTKKELKVVEEESAPTVDTLKFELELLKRTREEENEALERLQSFVQEKVLPMNVVKYAALGDTVKAVEVAFEDLRVREGGKGYNSQTHYIVNKARFEQLCVCMVSQRFKQYGKMAMATRLAELLELPGGDNEAREMLTGMYRRVANG